MERYHEFSFESYNWNASTHTATFTYAYDATLKFTETITWPSTLNNYKTSELDAALFALHIALGISYYKAYLAPNITVQSGTLTKKQAEFWNTVYTKGLGEFWYTNNVDWRNRISFPFIEKNNSELRVISDEYNNSENSKLENQNVNRKIRNPLVPIGGGKDSIVTIERIKAIGITPTLFRIGSHPLITKQAEIAHCSLHEVTRVFDASLIEHNQNGAYNGHIPITAINSFIATVSAILQNHDAVIFSNERSANVGNTTMHNLEINHQWSKSFEFETMMQTYIANFISPTIYYTSLLRPLSEIAIAKEIVRYPQYFAYSTSCNANWRLYKQAPTALWGKDEKSAFVFALYSAFLPEETVLQIFGFNAFNEPELVKTYEQLLGITGIKPFECVGTPNETLFALFTCLQQNKWIDSLTMNMFTEKIALHDVDVSTIKTELFSLDENHTLTPELLKAITPLTHVA